LIAEEKKGTQKPKGEGRLLYGWGDSPSSMRKGKDRADRWTRPKTHLQPEGKKCKGLHKQRRGDSRGFGGKQTGGAKVKKKTLSRK